MVAVFYNDFKRIINMIEKNTYDILRKAGWYEGRQIDISAAEKFFREKGVIISEAQKGFLREFSGLYVSHPTNNVHFLDLFSVQEIVENEYFDYFEKFDEAYTHYGTNFIMIGEYYPSAVYLTNDGLLWDCWQYLTGNSPLECIQRYIK